VDLLLAGGDDLELLFAAPREQIEPLRVGFGERFDIPLRPVGHLVTGAGVWLQDPSSAAGRRPLDGTSYTHFAESMNTSG
jgi:thiamine monophosphate kinase